MSRRSFGDVGPVALTLYCATFDRAPSRRPTNVEADHAPERSLPYMVFSPKAPQAVSTLAVGIRTAAGNVSPSASRNLGELPPACRAKMPMTSRPPSLSGARLSPEVAGLPWCKPRGRCGGVEVDDHLAAP